MTRNSMLSRGRAVSEVIGFLIPQWGVTDDIRQRALICQNFFSDRLSLSMGETYILLVTPV